MSKRDVGQEILEGVLEVKAYKKGEKALRSHTLTAGPASGYPRPVKSVTIGICKLDGRKLANSTGLGTRSAKTKRACARLVTDCRATA